jgi:hypothetical protein
VKRFDKPWFFGIELTFASGTAYHEHSQDKELRPATPHLFHPGPEASRQSCSEILVHKEERLHTDVAGGFVLKDQVALLELPTKGPLDHVEVTEVLAVTFEGAFAQSFLERRRRSHYARGSVRGPEGARICLIGLFGLGGAS